MKNVKLFSLPKIKFKNVIKIKKKDNNNEETTERKITKNKINKIYLTSSN